MNNLTEVPTLSVQQAQAEITSAYDSHQLPSIQSRSYVGWGDPQQLGYKALFSELNIRNVQKEVNRQCMNLINKNIWVVPEQIVNMLSSVLRNNSPMIGDIFTRFVIPSEVPRNDFLVINSRAINIMVSQIVEEERMTAYNESLTIWTTNYGDFNKHGLRRHDIIKTRQKDVQRGQFHMRY